ncbi:MAG: ORC1-type DNA replication protein [Candidatus Aenigmatarchaeota archaeon]
MEQKSLDQLFDDYMEQDDIFKDKEKLSTNYNPVDLPHREEEIKEMASILAPALKGNKPSNLFVYGKTGTGKTAVMKHVTSELRKSGKKNGKEVKITYLNCKLKKVADTEYRLVAELARKFGKDVPSTGLPTDEVYQRFFDAVDEEERILILILDEIDSLVEKTGDDFLYNLTRINENLERSQMTLVGISNDLSFTDELDPRVKSSLSEEEILFSPYDASQLQDILERRAEESFVEDSVPQSVIKKCSALAAQEHGDARRAIDLLRVSGELAERSSSTEVKKEHVDRAEDKINRNKIMEIVEDQPRQSQAVLWSILKLHNNGHDEIQTGDVYSVYKNVCESAGLKSLTQRRVSDLISELDMLGIIQASVTSKGRYGRTRIINTALPQEIRNELRSMLKERYYFN